MDIFGCCVARDIFGFHPDNKNYSVKKFIQWSSVVSAVTPPLEYVCGTKLTAEDCVNTNPFWQRTFLTDVNKTVFSELKDSRADWLLLDLSDTGFQLVRVIDQKSQTQTFVTGTSKLWENLPLIREHGKLSRCRTTAQPILEMDPEEILNCVKEFIGELCKIYSPERIVLLEVHWVTDVLSEAGFSILQSHSHWQAVNSLLDKCLFAAKQELPSSYVIRIPAGLYCDPNHKWGPGERHYCAEYYDYALKAFHVIAGESTANKQEMLDFLWKECSDLFHAQRRTYPQVPRHRRIKSVRQIALSIKHFFESE